MAHAVLMPKLSSTMTEGSVNIWLVKEGDFVKVGDPLFEVETDKIAIEVESYHEGYIRKIYVGVNEEVPCNSIIAYIGSENEEVPDSVNPDLPVENDVELDSKNTVSDEKTSTAHEGTNVVGIRATPYARKLVLDNDLDLAKIEGTGNKGRILAQDILTVLQRQKPSDREETKVSEVSLIPWKGMRKTIADNMVRSVSAIPHVNMVATANINQMMQFKNKIAETSGEKVTYTDLIAYMTIQALKQFPILNARTSEEGISVYKQINLGIAVSLEEGLIVPVIRNSNHLGVGDISKSIKDLASKGRESNLSKSDYGEGTFTISALGRTKVRSFTPIINYPEVGILGIGGIYENGQESYIDLTLSFDHRALDGAPASDFLDYLIKIIENPLLSIL